MIHAASFFIFSEQSFRNQGRRKQEIKRIKREYSSVMPYIAFRFYGALNDFLKPELRQKTILHPISGNQSAKDAIEAAGIPHTEAAMIVANGRPVGFDYKVVHGDRLAVYPPFSALPIDPAHDLQPHPSPPHRFVADAHLGKLARYLRMLGFDCLYRRDFSDQAIIARSTQENRIILTRDIGLLKNKRASLGYFVRSQRPEKQLAEIMNRYQLYEEARPFERCMVCNGTLEPVEKRQIENMLQPKTAQYFERFYRCDACGKIYWKGSHYDNMKDFIRRLTAG